MRAQNAEVLVNRAGNYLRFEGSDCRHLTRQSWQREVDFVDLSLYILSACISSRLAHLIFYAIIAQTLALMRYQAVAGMQLQILVLAEELGYVWV